MDTTLKSYAPIYTTYDFFLSSFLFFACVSHLHALNHQIFILDIDNLSKYKMPFFKQ